MESTCGGAEDQSQGLSPVAKTQSTKYSGRGNREQDTEVGAREEV